MAKSPKLPGKTIGQIYETRDYDKFSFEKGNREIKRSHVEALKKAFDKRYLMSPIEVDYKGRIKDGQHRFTAAQETGRPVRFIVVSAGETPIDVAEMNMLTRKWTSLDYSHSHCEKGNENYALYNKFREEFPMFSHSLAVSLLTGQSDRSSKAEEQFRTGELVVSNYDQAVKTANMLLDMQDVYEGYNRRPFVYALLKVAQVEGFEYEKLLKNIKKKCSLLKDFSQTADYVQALEKIYNWNNRNPLRFY